MASKEQRRFDHLYEQMLQDLVLEAHRPETGVLLHSRRQKPSSRRFVRRRSPARAHSNTGSGRGSRRSHDLSLLVRPHLPIPVTYLIFLKVKNLKE